MNQGNAAFAAEKVVISADTKLEMALYTLDNVPSDTASAMTLDQWRNAWVAEWQRANLAETKLEEIRAVLDDE